MGRWPGNDEATTSLRLAAALRTKSLAAVDWSNQRKHCILLFLVNMAAIKHPYCFVDLCHSHKAGVVMLKLDSEKAFAR